jgi:hypothetical protein
LDTLQARLRLKLKERGFVVRGRTFNCRTQGLTQVVHFQMGSFDPPGGEYIPGFSQNFYGKFTINVGVYVPEVAEYQRGGQARSFIHEYHCCVRSRLGKLGPERADLWWDLRETDQLAPELWLRLQRDAIPFLQQFETRDSILRQWMNSADTPYIGSPPRIVCAIILAGRAQGATAKQLLLAQAREARNPMHRDYVWNLAKRLRLGDLDG